MKRNLKEAIMALKKIVYVLPEKEKKQMAGMIAIIIIGSLFELLGVTAVLPFLQAVLTPEAVMESSYIQPFIKLFGIKTSNGVIALVGVGIIVVFVVKNAYMILSYYVRYDYATRVQKKISVKMLKSYMRRPYSYFLTSNSGLILRGCNSDTSSVNTILSDIFTLVSELLSALLIAIYIIWADVLTAIMAIIVMLIVMAAIVVGFKPIVKKKGKVNVAAQAEKNKAILQTINGVKELYAMQRQDLFVEQYEIASERGRKSQRDYSFINSTPDRIVEGVCLSSLIGIVLIRLLMGVDMTSFIPKLGTFAMAAFKLLPSIGKISSRVTEIVYYMPSLDNVYKNIIEANEYDREFRQKKQNESSDADVSFDSVVSINNVVFRYEEQKTPVLNGVSLDIHKGESIAFIGSSGAGKTTMSDIVLGLLTPSKGSVYVDGVDIFTIPKQWANIVGYVPQSVFLIDDTVRNNIAFGIKNIDDREIWDALEQAQLKEFVEKLPMGLDTIVGERGVKFSGGQRQRIAIARALYNKPELLILDEATAALDNETETAVMESIDALQGHITMIIVAHRLTTIRNCDKIYEVKDGKAVLREKSEVLG